MTAPQKEHPYALQEYVITEHELFLYESNGFWDRSERRDISALIRSRPAPSPQKTCMCDKYTNCTDCQQHDTAIRNATLDELIQTLWTDHIIHPDSAEGRYMKMLVQSLRKEQP
jgi:inhibitor of KinA sporulation pathway (predicted exonuclease)